MREEAETLDEVVPQERALAARDPLDIYVDELRRHPLLTREEEHELALRYRATGDRDAARRLITANLRLVVKIAHEYNRRGTHSLSDLVQEGNVGLVQALRKYDPERGVRLSSYAAWWVRAFMLRYILNNWHLVRIGTTPAQRKLFFNLRKEQAKLERDGFAAEPARLAEALEVPESEVVSMQGRLLRSDLSLDAPASNDEDDSRSRLERLPDGAPGPEETAESSELRAQLRAKIAAFGEGLKGRERTIFEERLLNDEPKTLQEIGRMYSISRERARQVEKRLVHRLRGYLRRELGEVVEIALEHAA
jgi:RNA polymerase sigma-32 factor